MENRIFLPGDILLPAHCDMRLWSVVACDQFTSQPEYWFEAENLVGGAPSTLRLMLPEAFFGVRDTAQETEKLLDNMESYLKTGVFRTVRDSYIYIERTLPDGMLRRGLLGLVDLEEYDYHRGVMSAVHSTEDVVEDRLPPRLEVRSRAALEMPHIMLFIDDAGRTVIEPLRDMVGGGDMEYDFDLMLGGGHITGWRVHGGAAAKVSGALAALADPAALREKYSADTLTAYAVGDGNHSLAAAKLYWEKLKPTLTEAERGNHPARFALAELVNAQDEAIGIEPIHRVLFGVDGGDFLAKARSELSSGSGNVRDVTVCTEASRETISVPAESMAELIGRCETFCRAYIASCGGKLDYIHDDQTAAGLASRHGSAGLLLPAMGKSELFSSIIASGGFPRKSFSVGHARDKRYYLECRRLK